MQGFTTETARTTAKINKFFFQYVLTGSQNMFKHNIKGLCYQYFFLISQDK